MNGLLKDVQELLRDNLLLEHNLVDKLAEPSIAHGQVSLIAADITPTVLDSPANRLAIFIQMHSSKDHGVGHQGLAIDQTLGLGHVEAHVEGQVVLEQLGVQNTGVTVKVLAHVSTEPDLKFVKKSDS